MKITVDSKTSRRVERYIVGKKKIIVEIPPNSKMTLTGEIADAFKNDIGAMTALKRNHGVTITDSFVAKTETKIEKPVIEKETEAGTVEKTAKEIVAELKNVRSIEELEAFKADAEKFASVDREYKRIEKKLK